MKKKLLILVGVLGLTLITAGVACATLTINFANVENSNIAFLGDGTFQFTPDGFSTSFSITSGTNLTGTTINLTGLLEGLFTISNIAGTAISQTGDVTGAGTMTIVDAANEHLVLGVQWLNIYTVLNTGGLNAGGTANLTYVSYGGLNPDLLAFAGGGVVTATYQFSGLNLPAGDYANLTYLTTHAVETSYSGSMTPIPIPPSALLLGTGLLGLVGLGYRRNRKG